MGGWGVGVGRTVSARFSVMLTFADGKLVWVFLLSDTEDQFRSENENSSSVPMPRQYNCLHITSDNNWAWMDKLEGLGPIMVLCQACICVCVCVVCVLDCVHLCDCCLCLRSLSSPFAATQWPSANDCVLCVTDELHGFSESNICRTKFTRE